jgi:hypothetical protein
MLGIAGKARGEGPRAVVIEKKVAPANRQRKPASAKKRA